MDKHWTITLKLLSQVTKCKVPFMIDSFNYREAGCHCHDHPPTIRIKSNPDIV